MDLSAFLLSVLSGILGAALLFSLREFILVPSRKQEQRKRQQVQRQLEKLYNPLFMLVKNTRLLDPAGEPNLAYVSDEVDLTSGALRTVSSQGKRDLDHIVLNYGYLADEELAEILPGLIGAAYYQSNINTPEVRKRMIQLIESGYKRLRKEYFAE